ncbi:MAG: hypothetical protein LC623_07380 [Halobacteriales archaeon]|nr:hypothetical protein [Halobacteriales archaeon]
MRALVGAAVLLLLAGCAVGGTDKYFPPAAELPDGLTPVSTASSEWKVVAPFLGMTSNPGHVGVVDRLPRQDLGKVESVDAYLLQGGDAAESYGILALRFGSADDIGAYLTQGESQACDNRDMAHVLRDGLTYVLVGGDASTGHGRAVLDHLASAVKERSGATLLC